MIAVIDETLGLDWLVKVMRIALHRAATDGSVDLGDLHAVETYLVACGFAPALVLARGGEVAEQTRRRLQRRAACRAIARDLAEVLVGFGFGVVAWPGIARATPPDGPTPNAWIEFVPVAAALGLIGIAIYLALHPGRRPGPDGADPQSDRSYWENRP